MSWFRETLYDSVEHGLHIDRPLHSGRSDFQKIEIFENKGVGKVLALDGIVQTTTTDEFIYHEMLTHLPAFGHGGLKRVLIIGGGDGGMLEEVLKHPVERVVMVELDGEVVRLCREYLPEICGTAFEDPRTDLKIADGAAFVGETDERFDLIITDRPDPVGPAAILFSERFYANCRRCLAPGGVLVTQNGVPYYQGPEVTETARHFRALFARHGFYIAPVPMYVGGFMAFGWASDSLDLAASEGGELAGLRYYNREIHRAAFALPGYVRDLIAAA